LRTIVHQAVKIGASRDVNSYLIAIQVSRRFYVVSIGTADNK